VDDVIGGVFRDRGPLVWGFTVTIGCSVHGGNSVLSGGVACFVENFDEIDRNIDISGNRVFMCHFLFLGAMALINYLCTTRIASLRGICIKLMAYIPSGRRSPKETERTSS